MSDWTQDAMNGNFKEVLLQQGDMSGLAAERCDEVVAELTARIRKWCLGQSLIPHASLHIMASIALAMAANGTEIGPEFRQQLIERARRMDSPAGELGLTDAAHQVTSYLCDSLER